MTLRRHEQPGRTGVALVTALALLAQPVMPALAQPKAATTPAQAKAIPAAAATAPAEDAPDGGWPRAYQTPSGVRFMVYQPQIADWADQRQMSAYAAVSVEQPGQQKPALGTIKIESGTKVALDVRMVSFSDMRLTETNFSTLPREQLRDVAAEITRAIPDDDRVIALDRVLASVDKSQIKARNVEGVKADPPAIFFSTTPAILVNIDGDPIWSPIEDNDLRFAVNTNWDLFQHAATSSYYLLHEGSWLTATDLKGAWIPATKLPASFSTLPSDENWKETRAAVPGRTLNAAKAPRVFVSTAPAELILLTGEPKYAPVAGTRLHWISNTEADLFRLGSTGAVYFLVAGRWFSAPDFTGPWTFATPNMPADFQRIPLEHPRSRVLAAVPGTQQAAEAVLLAQVPQTARVNRKDIKPPEVAYQGDPSFKPIEKTSLQYAVNTDKDVIKMGDLYYMCFQGVWFMSKSATGPWEVCSSVPKEIYSIPASSPVHNVTYVTVVEDNANDDWVTFAVVAGFTGVMIAWGCAVWGSGYYYPPYWGFGGLYPYYYPRYPTYGYAARYNPWTGSYGRGMAAYGPYGGAGVGARYNPRTGTYARGAAAYGPYGSGGFAEAYNPRTGAYGQTRQGSNVYGSWGSTAVQRGDDWARTSRVTNNVTGRTTRVTEGSGGGVAITGRGPGGTGGIARTGSGDVYAGHDGNVYRKQGGTWQKYENGNWSSAAVPRPTTATATAVPATRTTSARPTAANAGTINQLDRDARARAEGTQRTRDYGTARAGAYSGRSAGTYRPSRGGGARVRAGGGRRR